MFLCSSGEPELFGSKRPLLYLLNEPRTPSDCIGYGAPFSGSIEVFDLSNTLFILASISVGGSCVKDTEPPQLEGRWLGWPTLQRLVIQFD